MKEPMITVEIDKWLENEHYHHPHKGCNIFHKSTHGSIVDIVAIYHCLTCDKETSRGGWEWGWFNGTESKKLK
jgi:hypothetical protein